MLQNYFTSGTVKVIFAVIPSRDIFWTIISTFIFSLASNPNICADIPGLSGIPDIVILDSFLLELIH